MMDAKERILSPEERADLLREFRGAIMAEAKIEIMRMHGLLSDDLMDARMRIDRLESKLRMMLPDYDD